MFIYTMIVIIRRKNPVLGQGPTKESEYLCVESATHRTYATHNERERSWCMTTRAD